MKRMSWFCGLAVGVLLCNVTGCSTRLSVSGEKKPLQVSSSGVVDAYAACNGFRPYDGTILEAGVLDGDSRWGNLASLDVWPVGGLGISTIGARVKILPFELGFGILGYEPEPETYCRKRKPEEPEAPGAENQ